MDPGPSADPDLRGAALTPSLPTSLVRRLRTWVVAFAGQSTKVSNYPTSVTPGIGGTRLGQANVVSGVRVL